MKVVRTFSTSANVGPGFDTLGICFDLYNEYQFEISDEYCLIGFPEKYTYPKHNLIISSYEYVFKKLNKKIINIKLTQLSQNIPTSRGLGSSASCIVCGIMVANDVLNNILSQDEVFQFASELEGHPDNVAPLIYGGFTCSYKDDKFYKVQLNIHDSFKFMVCIPPFELSTSMARSVLPKSIQVKDAVFNISHSIAMIKALELGDMELLKSGKQDLIHEPYRYPLIKNSEKVINYANDNNSVCLISGAGSTLLIIGKENLKPIDDLKDWIFKEVKVNNKGAYIYEK